MLISLVAVCLMAITFTEAQYQPWQYYPQQNNNLCNQRGFGRYFKSHCDPRVEYQVSVPLSVCRNLEQYYQPRSMNKEGYWYWRMIKKVCSEKAPNPSPVGIIQIPPETTTMRGAEQPVTITQTITIPPTTQAPAPVNIQTTTQTPIPIRNSTTTQTPAPIIVPTTTQTPAPIIVPSTTQAPAPVEIQTTTQTPAPIEVPTTTQTPIPIRNSTTTETPAPIIDPTTTQTPAPIIVPSTTQAPAPVEIQTTTQTPAPIEVPTTTQAPAPVEIQTTTQTPAPIEVPTTTQTPAPIEVPTTTQAPAPVEIQTTTQTPAPIEVPTTTHTPAPIKVPTTTEAPAPVQIQTTTQTPAPIKVPTTTQTPIPTIASIKPIDLTVCDGNDDPKNNMESENLVKDVSTEDEGDLIDSSTESNFDRGDYTDCIDGKGYEIQTNIENELISTLGQPAKVNSSPSTGERYGYVNNRNWRGIYPPQFGVAPNPYPLTQQPTSVQSGKIDSSSSTGGRYGYVDNRNWRGIYLPQFGVAPNPYPLTQQPTFVRLGRTDSSPSTRERYGYPDNRDWKEIYPPTSRIPAPDYQEYIPRHPASYSSFSPCGVDYPVQPCLKPCSSSIEPCAYPYTLMKGHTSSPKPFIGERNNKKGGIILTLYK